MKVVSPTLGVLIVIVAAAIMLGVFSTYFPEVPEAGLPIADSQLVLYRDGYNAWIALKQSAPVSVDIGNQSNTEIQIELLLAKRANESWGGSNYWLTLPQCRISLWWIIASAIGLIVLVNIRQNVKRAGFPIDQSKNASDRAS